MNHDSDFLKAKEDPSDELRNMIKSPAQGVRKAGRRLRRWAGDLASARFRLENLLWGIES